ncbi:MAG: transglycosylase domain-containing protein [Candidatus Nealsonbacteria bacterium DGGOD1a]|nr:MAG: transglycosylase domain-containing protein [Candidatus Nealsonbacteria bacterium DGGOD1a]
MSKFKFPSFLRFGKKPSIFAKTGLALARLLGALAVLFLAAITLAGMLFIYYTRDLPRPEKFSEKTTAQSTKIYDRTGTILLYEIYGEAKRDWVSFDQIPDSVKKMAVAAEDKNFYKNNIGIDIEGIARSFLNYFKTKKINMGGSTIAQQLIRSTFLTNEKTAERKIREIAMAIELTRRYEKDQILEWYLNQVPFGQNTYGIGAASINYFNKPLSDISLAEQATLISLIQLPSYYPTHFDELMNRKNYVLNRMVEDGYLSGQDADAAKSFEVKFVEKKNEIKAPYFTLWVKKQLEEQYGKQFLEENGLTVHTSLDWNMQQTAEQVVRDGVKKNAAYYAYNAALVALDPKTGQVLAMTVGSGNYYDDPYPEGCVAGKNCLFDPQYNVAVMPPGRQPGSSFKPFVYATAFEKGYSDTTIVNDTPTCFGKWGGKEYCPQNYTGTFRGAVTLRSALAGSLNVPAVKVLNSLAGLNDSIAKAKEMGISTLNNPSSFYGLSLVLGGGEVTLLDMVSAYGVFATQGYRMPATAIVKITDNKGFAIYENNKTPQKILSARSANLISSILSDNAARTPIFGANSPLYFPEYNVAVKTGTTSDYKDGWIIGYTPSLAAGLWAGNSDNEPIKKEPGSVVAGPVFHAFMDKVLPGYPRESFPAP